MNADFEQFQYCQGDPLFYTEPTPDADTSPRFESEAAASWFRHESDGWVMRAPSARADVPEQGWKVHVSTIGSSAASVLSATSTVCVGHGTAFKHLSTMRELFLRNSKNYPREHAGKFITCYPREADLGSFLSELEAALEGEDGPYILSDKRWMRAPIYLRYGSFRRLTIPVDGHEVPAIRTPGGELVPDERGSTFLVPDWAPVPEVLADWVDAYDDDEETAIPPFRVTDSIKFSNGGGTYRAVTVDAAAQRLVVKEARPHAGLDAHLRTATERLDTEHRALVDLADTGVVPRVVWAGPLWEHQFLALEEVPGVTLQKWIGRNFPVYGTGAIVDAYYRNVLAIAHAVTAAVEQVHARGWAHQDLHPRNIILRSIGDTSLALIDFEAACPLSDDARTQDFGFPGFRSLSPRTPVESDWFGVHQIVAYLVLPLVNLTELTESYTVQSVGFAARRGAVQTSPGTSAIFDEIDSMLADLRRRARLDVPVDAVAGTVTAPAGANTIDAATPPPQIVGIGRMAGRRATTLRDINTSTLAGIRRARALSRPGQAPIHYEGLIEGATGLAYGTAGLLVARDAFDRPSTDVKADDLIAVTRASVVAACGAIAHAMPLDCSPDAAPAPEPRAFRGGLFTGAMGDLVGLAAAGDTAFVDDVLDTHLDLFVRVPYGRVYDGAPGELLGLMHLAAHGIRSSDAVDAVAGRAAAALADAYLTDPRAFSPVGEPGRVMANQSRYQDSGLLYGHLGVAWALATAARRYDRTDLADAAVAAIHNELSRYKAVDGCLQFEQAGRLLPYLATGSAGFGIVLPLLGDTIVAEEFGDALTQLIAATDLDFCSAPGLFNGYAGLVLGNDALRRLAGLPPTADDRIIAGLDVHALALGGGRVFGGDSEFRISTDFATGSAGISWALSALERSRGLSPTRPLSAVMQSERRLFTTT